MLNQEEENLQKEIMSLHMKEMGKVRDLEFKHNIHPSYKNSNRQYPEQNPYFSPLRKSICMIFSNNI